MKLNLVWSHVPDIFLQWSTLKDHCFIFLQGWSDAVTQNPSAEILSSVSVKVINVCFFFLFESLYINNDCLQNALNVCENASVIARFQTCIDYFS